MQHVKIMVSSMSNTQLVVDIHDVAASWKSISKVIIKWSLCFQRDNYQRLPHSQCLSNFWLSTYFLLHFIFFCILCIVFGVPGSVGFFLLVGSRFDSDSLAVSWNLLLCSRELCLVEGLQNALRQFPLARLSPLTSHTSQSITLTVYYPPQ